MRYIFSLLFALLACPAFAQVTPGTSPLSGAKGGTNNAFMQFTGPASSLKTFTLPNASDTLAALAQIQTWTGAQSFSDGKLILLGSSSGSTTLKAPATGGGTATFFTGADTIVGLISIQSLTNKTLSGSTNVLGGVTMTLGSDATGDIYYRSSGGVLTRLGVGSNSNVLTLSAGLPAWQPGAAAASINVGTTTVAGACTTAFLIFNNASTTGCESIASILTAGTGITITGTTNATIGLAFTSATLQANPSNPTGTTSATGVMMGLGVTTCRVTPTQSGRMRVAVQGNTATSTVSTSSFALRFGTGAGPANGVAATGTLVNATISAGSALAGATLPFRTEGIITGLALATAIWLDISYFTASGTATLTNLSCDAQEF